MTDWAEVTEHLFLHLPPRPDVEIADVGWGVLSDRPVDIPELRTAQRLRIDDVDAARAEARAWFAARGRDRFTWYVGGTARPQGLADLLVARGAAHVEDLTGMVLREAPPAVPCVEVRRVDTFDEFVTAKTIAAAAFGAALAPHDELAREFEQRGDDGAAYLAFLDGRPVARASCVETDAGALALMGGATLADARGRGLYRALVHARWLEAQRRGLDALVVQAAPTSRPILERLGFRPVSSLRILLDTVA